MSTQAEKAEKLRSLHGSGIFIIPNPWDAGTARVLTGLRFDALATTSAAVAATLGKRDKELAREEVLANAQSIVMATDLPVSGDLQNGYGDSPDAVAETIRLAAAAGLVGASIEDASRDPSYPIYDKSLAVERICAAVEVARSLPFPFVLTARAENYNRGRNDLKDTIERLQAYEAAGADVLFAPYLPDLPTIHTVRASLSRPLNVMIGPKGQCFSIRDLAAVGVRRVSVGATLYRAVAASLLSACHEMADHKTFTFAESLPGLNEFYALMEGRA